EHRTSAAALRVGEQTRRAHLAIDSGLASADLTFTADHVTRKRTFGCHTFLAPEASHVTWTVGRLNGTFAFNPNESYLRPTSTSVRALIERILPTGERCPHPRQTRCYQQWAFGFGTADAFVSVNKFPPWSRSSFV